MYPLLADSSVKLIRKFWFILSGSSLLLFLGASLFQNSSIGEPLPKFFQWYIMGVSVAFFGLALVVNRAAITINDGTSPAVDRKGRAFKDPEQQILLMIVLGLAGLDLIALGGFFVQWRSGHNGPGIPYFMTSLLGFILTFPSASKLKGRKTENVEARP